MQYVGSGGGVGSFEATRMATGNQNRNGFEINGTKGALRFNFERMNELEIFLLSDSPGTCGFRTVLATDPENLNVLYALAFQIRQKELLASPRSYAHATEESFADEMSTAEGRALLDDLADYGVPVVLFSGGETAGLQTGTWYEKGKDTMTALSAKTGRKLWSVFGPGAVSAGKKPKKYYSRSDPETGQGGHPNVHYTVGAAGIVLEIDTQ